MKKFFQLSFAFILNILFFNGLAFAQSPEQTKKDINSARFSLAIRGGASKGAYEAGLNWGQLKFSRNMSDSKTTIGGKAYNIELESITGASAGGINTLLSGLTWCSRSEEDGGIHNSISDNIFRDIWLRVDIETLLPEFSDSDDYLHDDAVLSRKDFLQAASEMRDTWNQPFFRKGCQIPLGVTVTRIEPDELSVGNVNVQNQRFYVPFELRVTKDSTIDFFFDPANYPNLADPAMILLPWEKQNDAFSINDERIIDLSFTTSAYPMAFGRKRLNYCRLMTHQDNEELVKKENDLLCPEDYELTEAEFSDGGLFDNLPIGLARLLAERSQKSKENTYPVTYIYLDPNQIHYKIPEVDRKLACDGDNPPKACRTMTFNLASESKMLLNAMGTARTYELYRELTSDNWQLNMSEISYKLSKILKQRNENFKCDKELPFFTYSLNCTEALIRAGRLLEFSYDIKRPIINEPYSIKHLTDIGITRNCKTIKLTSNSEKQTECTFNIHYFRNQLADAMKIISEKNNLQKNKLYNDIDRSKLTLHNDRSLRVSSRSSPITGTMLESFGSFFDYKFREYDYYIGVYDSLVMSVKNLCELQYSSTYQTEKYRQCFNDAAKHFYTILKIDNDPRGKYIFALLAKQEFGNKGLFNFSYNPMPTEDKDMKTIYYGLQKALHDEESAQTFFEHLAAEGFVATPKKNGKPSVLALILEDTDTWGAELTRRITNRIVHLETKTDKIYKKREPDIEKRDTANTDLMGVTAFMLQSATYRTPDTSFSQSTAPTNWVWRNIIPYEVSLDLNEGDILATWNPSIAVSNKDLLGIRGSIGSTGGLFSSTDDETREDYLSLGLSYTRKTNGIIASGYGISPIWYRTFSKPDIGEQYTQGAEIFFNLFKDRIRLGLGVRDFDNGSDTVFFTLGVTDIPGLVYWLSR